MNQYIKGGLAAIFVVASLTAVIGISSASAHSGGTDKYGCHAGSLPYHCNHFSKRRTTTIVVDQRDDQIASLQQEVKQLRMRLGILENRVANVREDIADIIHACK